MYPDEPTPVSPAGIPVPTVGRILHFVSRGSADGAYPPRDTPLIVTDSYSITDVDDNIHLCVDGWTLNPNGIRYETGAPHNDHGKPGSWHWPERE